MARNPAASVNNPSSSIGRGLPPETRSGTGTHSAPKASPIAPVAVFERQHRPERAGFGEDTYALMGPSSVSIGPSLIA
jgi:hypothetical protein